MTTIGFIGAGKLAPRMIRSLMDDQLEAHDDLTLLIPASKKHFTDEIDAIVAWAEKNNVSYTLLIDPTTNEVAIEDVIEGAAGEIEVAKGKMPTTMASAIAEVDGRLFVLWDEDDDDGYLAFETAYEAGVECYDMVNGLERLSFDDEAEATEAEPAEPEPEEAPEKPEGEGVNTRAEMMRMKVPDLKKMIEERGITINREGKGRIAKGAYVDAILAYDETGHAVFMQEGTNTAVPIEDDEIAQANDDDVPNEDTPPEDEPEADEPALTEDEEPAQPVEEDEEPRSPAEEGETRTESSGPWVGPASRTSATEAYLTVNTTAAPARGSSLVGNCGGCGGPIFAIEEADAWPSVKFFHAEGCTIQQ